MTKTSIFNVEACRTTINQMQLEELIGFLIKNRSIISFNDTRGILTTRALTETPINRLYEKYVVTGINAGQSKGNNFAFIKIPPDTSAPEVVTYTYATFDMKQIKSVSENLFKAAAIVPEFSNKIVLNITPLVKKNNELSSVSLFQSLVLRDLLSRSFFMSNDVWLPPSILQFLCKTYSMSVALAISQVYSLTYPDQQTIAAIFSLFFLKQATNMPTAELLLKNADKLLIGSTAEITEVIKRVKDILGERYMSMSFNDACECVRNIGIPRLSELSRRFLYTKLRNIGPDTMTTAISLEYPPYWLYLNLLAGSGQKIGLLYTMKNLNLIRNIEQMTDELFRNQSLMNLMI